MNQFFHWLWAPIKLFNNFYRQNTPFCKQHVSTKTTVCVFFLGYTYPITHTRYFVYSLSASLFLPMFVVCLISPLISHANDQILWRKKKRYYHDIFHYHRIQIQTRNWDTLFANFLNMEKRNFFLLLLFFSTAIQHTIKKKREL